MATMNINIRTDRAVKTKAQRLFAQLGLDMTTAINLFLRQALRERALPFRVQMDTPNAELLEAVENVEAGRNLEGPFATAAEAVRSMLKD
jgi:DNA-damage-inducible protein J